MIYYVYARTVDARHGNFSLATGTKVSGYLPGYSRDINFQWAKFDKKRDAVKFAKDCEEKQWWIVS